MQDFMVFIVSIVHNFFGKRQHQTAKRDYDTLCKGLFPGWMRITHVHVHRLFVGKFVGMINYK